MGQNFYEICTKFFKKKYKEISAFNFYRALFFKGSLQSSAERSNKKYNAIAVEICKTERSFKTKRFTIGDDLEHLDDLLLSENFVVISPISYVGKARTAKNARLLYALVFDLDGIKGEQGLSNLFFQMQNELLPYSNYVACTGNGIHIYYMFEEPIPLFPSVIIPLEKLKNYLTRQIWNRYVTTFCGERDVQYEPIWQGFRMVGGVTKDYEQTNHRVKVWEVSSHKITLEYLNQFVPEEYAIPKNAIQYQSKMTLEKAKENYPYWYERRILRKDGKKYWTIKPALYEWWLRKIKNEAVVGHRYYCIMCLAIYAKKCGIDFDRLEKDAYELQKLFDGMTTDATNRFTRQDVKDALQSFREEFCTMPINSIVHFSGIPIQKNKRNGRKRSDHIKIMNFIREEINQNKEWRKGNGRKSVQNRVFEFLDKNPSASCREFCEQTGLKKSVFYKYKKLFQEKKCDKNL